MKTVALLFFFAFVPAFTAPTTKPAHELKMIMDEANKTLNGGPKFQAFLDRLVPARFNQEHCKSKDFCLAEKILSSINHTEYGTPANHLWKISRVLKQYNKSHPSNCTVKEKGDEEELRTLLTNLSNCAQVIYSRHDPAAHHKQPQRSAEGTDGNSVNRA